MNDSVIEIQRHLIIFFSIDSKAKLMLLLHSLWKLQLQMLNVLQRGLFADGTLSSTAMYLKRLRFYEAFLRSAHYDLITCLDATSVRKSTVCPFPGVRCPVRFWRLKRMSLNPRGAVCGSGFIRVGARHRAWHTRDKLSAHVTTIISMKCIDPLRVGKLANAPRERSGDKPKELRLLLTMTQPLHPTSA